MTLRRKPEGDDIPTFIYQQNIRVFLGKPLPPPRSLNDSHSPGFRYIFHPATLVLPAIFGTLSALESMRGSFVAAPGSTTTFHPRFSTAPRHCTLAYPLENQIRQAAFPPPLSPVAWRQLRQHITYSTGPLITNSSFG